MSRRFLINLPAEELSTRTRLGFQLEQAFWFYEDFYRSAAPGRLPKLTLKTFSHRLLHHRPTELPFHPPPSDVEIDALLDEFYQYKSHVPTCGAIILDETLSKCLVVRGFSSKSTWGFPKGKIAKDETPAECAQREVREETGFDIGPWLREEDFLQVEVQQQPIRLYIIVGIPEGTHFAPLTRREIRDIQWHRIDKVKYEKNSSGNRYFNVMPFMDRLRRWIRHFRKQHDIKDEEPHMVDHDSDAGLGELLEALGPIETRPREVDPTCRSLIDRIHVLLRPLQSFIPDLDSLRRAYRIDA